MMAGAMALSAKARHPLRVLYRKDPALDCHKMAAISLLSGRTLLLSLSGCTAMQNSKLGPTAADQTTEFASRTDRGDGLARVIELTQDNLDYAYSKGVMTLYACSTEGRRVVLLDGREIVDFARGSYLGLDNHPAILRGAIEALHNYRSLQWSGARTRLNFAFRLIPLCPVDTAGGGASARDHPTSWCPRKQGDKPFLH